MVAIIGVALLMSSNRKAISFRLVLSGLLLQWLLAVFVLRTEAGQALFGAIGSMITALLNFSDKGAAFVFGPLVDRPDKIVQLFGPGAAYIFAFRVVATVIFVCSLVNITYYLGIMQKVVECVAKVIAFVMGASGVEALSNVSTGFVGMVESQILIRPYISSLTNSELLATMSGSMACISAGVLAVYIGMGMKPSYMLAASIMAAPAALVVAKIVCPETEESKTKGTVQVHVERTSANLIDAAARGAADGLRIGLSVCAMLIAFIAAIHLADSATAVAGRWFFDLGLRANLVGLRLDDLKLFDVIGVMLRPVAWLLGVPWMESQTVGRLMGEKLVLNEFVAYTDLSTILRGTTAQHLSAVSEAVATVALCGFANFGSIAMQIGGIGEIAPSRRADAARLGIKALICGTMASFLSACIAGLLI